MTALPPLLTPAPGEPLLHLLQSRARLRAVLQGDAAEAAPSGQAWQLGLGALPVAGLLATVLQPVLQQWRGPPPWGAVATIAADQGREAVQGLALRHPLGLVMGALLAGAAVTALRPERLLAKPAVWAGLLPLLIRAAASHGAATARSAPASPSRAP